MGELSYFDLEGLFVDTESFYLTLGRRLGNWLPHFTFSKLYSTDNHLRYSPEIGNHKDSLEPGSDEQVAVATIEALAPVLWDQKSSAYTLGVNYFFAPQVVGKAEVKMVTEREGTVAHFQNANTSSEIIPIVPADDEILIYGLSLDVVF